MSKFQKSVKYWYDKSALALKHRNSKKEELLKRFRLLEHSKTTPNFSINTVNICGVYNIAGGNPDNGESYYSGILRIDLIDSQIEASWFIEGEEHQTGYGFVFNNTLVIHFNYIIDDEVFNGLVAYEFITLDIVIGKWTEEIAIENAFEMGRKLSPSELGQSNSQDFFSAN